jgi:import inner membrane translocase subunit TIM22
MAFPGTTGGVAPMGGLGGSPGMQGMNDQEQAMVKMVRDSINLYLHAVLTDAQ